MENAHTALGHTAWARGASPCEHGWLEAQELHFHDVEVLVHPFPFIVVARKSRFTVTSTERLNVELGTAAQAANVLSIFAGETLQFADDQVVDLKNPYIQVL